MNTPLQTRRDFVKTTALATVALICLLATVIAHADEVDFTSIFDGKTLAGWHASAQTGHSRASKNMSGGKWVVEDGAIIGSQDIPGNGGIIITDEQYGDFEVALEMRNDFGPDSGLFLRSTEDGTAFQAMIDYHANGNLMGLYGEGRLGARPSVMNFAFRDKVTDIREVNTPVSPPLPVLPEAWAKFWRHGEWNELRARIVGNPPHLTTWINGVKFCEWQETERRHPDTGGIALQVHGGGDLTRQFVRYRNIRVKKLVATPDNALTEAERRDGWVLLSDGKTHAGWMNSDRTAPRTPVQDGALNPHRAGHYMLVHTQQWSNYVLALDFKITPRCNSGIFMRTASLDPRPGKDVGFNGLEIAIDDTFTAGFHDTGALYDLAKPTRNAMRAVGEWNHIEITSRDSLIEIVLNGETVNSIDLAKFTAANKRPDGLSHKFDIAFRDHPKSGYIGLQDHRLALLVQEHQTQAAPGELTWLNGTYPMVVITDWTFPDVGVEEAILKAHGVGLLARQCKTEADLIDLCADADVVITQFARVNANVVSALRKARAIVRYGIGVDNIDLDAARERGIPVCNVPDYCIDEVADQTLAFILATTRQVVTHVNHLRAGQWGLATPLAGMKALRDLTVGVVGFGRIGREVVRRLIPFKCSVQVSDPAVPAAQIEKLGARAVNFEELLKNADVLTLHCPSTPQTRRLMNRETFGKLKPGTIFINVSRGDLADPDALTAALQSGQLAAAALDVFDPEPIPADHPIRTMPNVILAPHIASCSMPAVTKLRESVANLAIAAVRGQSLPTIVNGVKQ